MNKKIKRVLAGAAVWVPSVYLFAYFVSQAGPVNEELYPTAIGTSIEIFSMLFAIAFFCGVPVLTGLWAAGQFDDKDPNERGGWS